MNTFNVNYFIYDENVVIVHDVYLFHLFFFRVRAQTGLVLHDILPLELKKYDKNRPPKYEGQATIVYFHVTVLSVDSINEESMVRIG